MHSTREYLVFHYYLGTFLLFVVWFGVWLCCFCIGFGRFFCKSCICVLGFHWLVVCPFLLRFHFYSMHFTGIFATLIVRIMCIISLIN